MPTEILPPPIKSVDNEGEVRASTKSLPVVEFISARTGTVLSVEDTPISVGTLFASRFAVAMLVPPYPKSYDPNLSHD
ncbi:hypothetical protein LCGC14_1670830 [marine sediment metagenome]|uniref:Uncharacterized protein n=1 Tax=marine sediment metagenome TaxID=412755 RepID=A0A0F9K766_9ZZZZ